MKKIVALVLAVILMCGVALADGVDLSGMSLEELLVLQKDVSLEVNRRLNNGATPISAGEYVVGKDIKAGTYKIVIAEAFASYAEVAIYSSDGEREWAASSKAGMDVMVTLEEGHSLNMYYTSGTIVAVPKMDWMP